MQYSDEQVFELFQSEKISNIKKSPQQLRSIVKIVFDDPGALVKRFLKLSQRVRFQTQKKQSIQLQKQNKSMMQTIHSHRHPHNLNIEMVQNFYKNVKQLKLNSDLATCLDKSFSKFQIQGQLKQYLNSNKQMLYFFIVIFWDDLFTDPNYRLLMQKCLNLIAHTGTYRQVMSQWMDDLSNQKVVFLVVNVQKYFDQELQKLRPGVIDPSLIKFVEKHLKNYCMFLQQLHESDKRQSRIPKQAFINQKITSLFDPANQFRTHLRKQTALNFLLYPFLLNLEFKQKMLEIQSIFQQKVNMQKSIQQGFQHLAMGMIANGNFSIQGLIFLHFKINRTNILDDSLQKLGKATQNLKSPMRIQFIGQQGADEGGVKNQYFQLLVKQIFNPYLDMFLPKNKGRVYWFNAFSFQPPIRFEFVGMLLGLAIYNSVLLDIKFPRALYRKILQADHKQQEQDLSSQVLLDLSEIQPQIADSLNKILKQTDPQAIDSLILYFNIEFENFGEKIIEQLVQQGSQIRVTIENKNQYVQLYADYFLNKHTKKQFNAFKRGFNRVVNGEMIHLLQPQELERIICGATNIDFKELQTSAHYEGGYNKNSSVIKYLWEVLHNLNDQEKKAFLIFLTGTDRVPIEGLKGIKFVIQKHGADTSHLPTAHTCFNVLLLPEYQNQKKLEDKLKLAMKHNQGFGLI